MESAFNTILRYINPLAQLGKRSYSYRFPLFLSVVVAVLLEIYSNRILNDPDAVGMYAIFLFIALIIYFSFRDGVRGGFITTVITLSYYIYIIVSRNYTGEQLVRGVETVLLLGVVYFVLAATIGWLKQMIDRLIEREVDEKRWLQAIIQQLPVGVVITDKDGKITHVNRQIETLLGIKIPIGSRISHQSLLKLGKQGKPEASSQNPLEKVLTTGRAIISHEFQIVRQNGKKVSLQVSASPIHNKAGKVIAAAEIIHDITSQKELEARKDDFVNMASHELKTPLTSMKLYVDSLALRLKQANDDKAVKTLENIKHQTDRLQELVNDLLDVSRIQTGKLTFTKMKFRVDELLKEIVEELQASAKQKLVITHSPAISLFADRFRMYQVITNLITNAMKYSPGEKDILIRVKREKGNAVLSVEDFGIGIAKEQQQKIFDKLYQVTDDNEKTFPGFGMGLYITKQIITHHRGSIRVVSEKGKGSTFYVSLPLPKKSV